MPSPATPERRILLDFEEGGAAAEAGLPIRANLSVCKFAEASLWVASDETATVERLEPAGDGRYGNHRSYRLTEFFDLPEGDEGEADIEGLAIDGGYLWVVGSHSLARKKPKRHENDRQAALDRLTRVKRDPNRFFLGRIPMTAGERNGIPDLHPEDGDRRADCLKMTKTGNVLTDALRKDAHIGRFLDIPSKDNGLDVEGIAARGSRAFLGLRGPVLRGWATVLELDLKTSKPGRLKPRRIGAGGERYRKHFLDLDGLGVREMVFDGDDLLLLAGPTMDLDGPVALFRWSGALDAGYETVIPQGPELKRVMDLPYGVGCDHAEGIALLPGRERPGELMVVYDSPAKDRLHGNGTAIDADVFAMSKAKAKRGRPKLSAPSGRARPSRTGRGG